VTAGELGLTVFPGCGGFYAADLAGIVKEKLPERYRGHLPTIVLNDSLYSDAFDVCDRHLANAIIAHEPGTRCELWDGTLPEFNPSNHGELLKIVQKEIAIEPGNGKDIQPRHGKGMNSGFCEVWHTRNTGSIGSIARLTTN
jgi:hypothetical protein